MDSLARILTIQGLNQKGNNHRNLKFTQTRGGLHWVTVIRYNGVYTTIHTFQLHCTLRNCLFGGQTGGLGTDSSGFKCQLCYP